MSTLHVRVTSDTQTIQSSDWPKSVMTLRNFPPFVESNVVLDGPTNWLSKQQLGRKTDTRECNNSMQSEPYSRGSTFG